MGIHPDNYNWITRQIRLHNEAEYHGHTIKFGDFGFFTIEDDRTGEIVFGPEQNTIPECMIFIDARIV
jgi:hypothetical protein